MTTMITAQEARDLYDFSPPCPEESPENQLAEFQASIECRIRDVAKDHRAFSDAFPVSIHADLLGWLRGLGYTAEPAPEFGAMYLTIGWHG